MEEFLSGKRRKFDLEFSIPESFTGKVMEEMLKIPYGDTRIYGEISSRLESSAIAVGNACGSNPLPLIVPWHRLVSKDGIGGLMAGKTVRPREGCWNWRNSFQSFSPNLDCVTNEGWTFFCRQHLGPLQNPF